MDDVSRLDGEIDRLYSHLESAKRGVIEDILGLHMQHEGGLPVFLLKRDIDTLWDPFVLHCDSEEYNGHRWREAVELIGGKPHKPQLKYVIDLSYCETRMSEEMLSAYIDNHKLWIYAQELERRILILEKEKKEAEYVERECERLVDKLNSSTRSLVP